MEEPELRALISEVRAFGREESTTIEFKRKWWSLEHTAQVQEFRKDIAGLANSIADVNANRHIIVGMDPKGTLFESPLPRDEADLQQLLLQIQPVPDVAFRTHIINGTTIIVITIRAPFDRPYVVQNKQQYTIPVRMGSRTGTASRAHLDSYYSEKTPKPNVVVEWGTETSELGRASLEEAWERETPDNWSTTEVMIRSPKWESFDALIASINSEATKVMEEIGTSGDLTHSDKQVLWSYSSELRSFAAGLDAESFERWYTKTHGDELCTNYAVRLNNIGSRPATRGVVSIELPDGFRWTQPESDWVDGSVPKRPERPMLSADRRAADEILRRMAKKTVVPDSVASVLGAQSHRFLLPPPESYASSIERQVAEIESLQRRMAAPSRPRSIAELDGQTMTIEFDELLQAHSELMFRQLKLLALPGTAPGRHKARARVFWLEASGYREQGFELVVER